MRVDQLAGSAPQLTRHKRTAVPLASIVNRPRYEFLAGPVSPKMSTGTSDRLTRRPWHNLPRACLFADDLFARVGSSKQ